MQSELDLHLHSLAEKQLVRTDHSRTEENAFRFHHVLIRDTAYDGILKRARATFHEQFVEWADSVNREGATEYEEILGYHLEHAHRYLSELGPLDDHGRALGADGSRRLAAAGRRAFARGDAPAAANLLQRAQALLPEDVDGRLELLAESGDAMLQAGRFGEAEDALGEAIARGEATGARRVVAHASLMSLIVQLRTGDSEGWHDRAAATAAEAMAVFEEIGDHAGLARGWRLLAWTHGTSLQYGMAAETSANAIEHARLAGDARLLTQSAMEYAAAAALGSTPVAEAIERSEQVLLQVSGDRHAEAVIRGILGSLVACQGSFDRARELASQSLATLEDLRMDVAYARMCLESWRVEMLAGELLAAERVLRDAYDRLQSLGETYLLSTVSGLLGQTVYELGRFEEAESLGLECRELATEDDIDTQTLWRCLLGKVVARKGSPGEGERLIREALEMLAPTDDLPYQCASLLDLAAVQETTGSPERRADARARAGHGPGEGKPRSGRADPAHAGCDVARPRSRSATHTGCVNAADRRSADQPRSRHLGAWGLAESPFPVGAVPGVDHGRCRRCGRRVYPTAGNLVSRGWTREECAAALLVDHDERADVRLCAGRRCRSRSSRTSSPCT